MESGKKRFPADTKMDKTTFLNDKKINGELYALLQTLSSFEIINKKENIYKTFITKKNMLTQAEMCKRLGIKSPKTLRKHLEYLKEQNYIEESDKKDIVYYLPEMEDIYSLLPTETINYLVDSCKPHVIKLYIFLGQRYMLAMKQWGRPYQFSIKQLADHIGLDLQNHSRNYEVINNALLLLQNSGLIDYYDYFDGQKPIKILRSFSQIVKRPDING